VSTGHVVELAFATAGMTHKRVVAGERCDVVLASARVIDALGHDGKVDISGKRDLGAIKIGVGVRNGDPAPDISTLDAFKRTLRAVPSFAYSHPSSGASSGVHFAKVVKDLGMEAELASKTVFREGGTAVMRAVSDKQADLGITQISEILPNPGVYVVGPLPAEVQNATTYTVAPCSGTPHAALVKSWIDTLRGENAQALLRKAGFETP
jgi:molybdate transport system substrate-binding protein